MSEGVARMGENGKNFEGKRKGKRPNARLSRRLEDNIKVNRKIIE